MMQASGVAPGDTMPPGNWYHASAHVRPPRPALREPVEADVCIIGAGITGCSAALHLAERGYRVAVLEAEAVGFGASGRSGGQMIAGYNRDQDTITDIVGAQDAQRLWELNEEALALTASLIEKHQISCDFTRGHIHVGCKPRHAQALEHEAEAWTRLGRRGVEFWGAEQTQKRVASPRYTSALYDPNGAHLHPLNYTLGLAQAAEDAGAVIYEHSPMTHWVQASPKQIEITTPEGAVRCQWMILAGNAHLWRQQRDIGRKIMPVGTYILATEPLGQERAQALIPGNEAVADINFVLNYFRLSADLRLLFGGRVSYSGLDPANIKAAMHRTMVDVFPQLANVEATHAWGGHVAITVNRLPHFGRLSPSVYFAHGFSGHGIALTGLAGHLMADAIAGQAEKFDVFARIPHRTFPGGTWLRTPALVLAMAWHRLRDML